MNTYKKGEHWCVTGASGLLGHAFAKVLIKRHIKTLALENMHFLDLKSEHLISRKIDLLKIDDVKKIITEFTPSVIIHCAGLTNVDQCESNPQLAEQLNKATAQSLSVLSKKIGCKFVYISTDHLFDGTRSFYSETDLVCPLNVYGMTKHQGESVTIENSPDALVIRTNFFGKGLSWRQSLTDWLWARYSREEPIPAFLDSYFTPISMAYLVDIIIQLIDRGANGIFNVCGRERLSKNDFALQFGEYFKFDLNLVQPIYLKQANLKAMRPLDMSLCTQKISNYLGAEMPSVRQSFDALKEEYL